MGRELRAWARATGLLLTLVATTATLVAVGLATVNF